MDTGMDYMLLIIVATCFYWPEIIKYPEFKKDTHLVTDLTSQEFKRGDGWVGCFYQIILCNFVWTKLPSPLSIRSLFEIDYFPLCWEKCAQMCKNFLRISQLASLDSWEIFWLKSGKRRKTKICLDLLKERRFHIASHLPERGQHLFWNFNSQNTVLV